MVILSSLLIKRQMLLCHAQCYGIRYAYVYDCEQQSGICVDTQV